MSALDDIAVREEPLAGAPSPQVRAIVSEIAGHLAGLRDSGECAAIDLRSLPMAPGDYQALKALLGEGEVSASLDALGESEIRETAVPGVWWLVHRNAAGEVLADLIEITDCPAILHTQPEDLQAAATVLQARIERAEDGLQ